MTDNAQNENKPQIPQSPTNYKQPPTPDHPPPSSSQAEKIIHERIRPLSQEYKRRSALLQLQKTQQMLIDMGTSPLRQMNLNNNNSSTVMRAASSASQSHYDYAYLPSQSPTKLLNANNLSSDIYSTIRTAGIRGSSGSLSSSLSLSDHSHSTENVEEYMGESPLAGLMKGSAAMNNNGRAKIEPAYATVNKSAKSSPPQVQLPPPRPQQQLPAQAQPAQGPQVPVYATIHKKRGISSTTQQSNELNNKPRPPIPAKPVIPERRLFKAQTPQLPVMELQDKFAAADHAQDQEMKQLQSPEDHYEDISEFKRAEPPAVAPAVTEKRDNNEASNKQENKTTKQQPVKKTTQDLLSHQSSLNSSSNEEQSQQTSNSQPTNNESSNEDSSLLQQTTTNSSSTTTQTGTQRSSSTSSASHESSILSPFNAEEARKKISEIIESFGSSIFSTDISPTNEIDIDFDEMPAERQELSDRLKAAGLKAVEKKLYEHGYDNFRFMV